jgi:hypothetical protein
VVAEIARVNSWMWSTLAGDSALNTAVSGRIYAEEAPQGAAVPMVIFAHLGGSTRERTLRGHVLTSLYMVRAISEGSSFDAITPLADRIDAVMTVPSGGTVVDGVRITQIRVDQPHQRKDSSEGVPVVYLGAIYRVDFQPASQ